MSKTKIYDESFSARMKYIQETQFKDNGSRFASAVGVAQASLARWVKGEADPSRSNLIKIAEVANVSLEWLATGRSYEDEYKIEAPRQELSVKEAITALEQAIARLPLEEVKTISDEFSEKERQLIQHYRVTDEIGKMKIETTAEVVASMTTSADDYKKIIEDSVA